MKWNLIDQLPESFFNVTPENILETFPEPTLIHIKGQKEEPLFLSILLHGNETSSLTITQKLLLKYKTRILPRSILLFVGNVKACQQNLRFLPDQLDFNRMWQEGAQPENKMALEIMQKAFEHKLFASIDIHNNTGLNPLYSCINQKNLHNLYLAQMFSHTTVYFVRPENVQSKAFSKQVPSVTLECGKSQNLEGIERALNFVDSVLHLSEIPEWNPRKSPLDVFHSFCRIFVPKDCSIGFCHENKCEYDFCFSEELEKLNFTPLKAGHKIGEAMRVDQFLKIIDENNKDISHELLEYVDGNILLKKDLTPSMFTKDVKVIHQDCLGYFMRPMKF